MHKFTVKTAVYVGDASHLPYLASRVSHAESQTPTVFLAGNRLCGCRGGPYTTAFPYGVFF